MHAQTLSPSIPGKLFPRAYQPKHGENRMAHEGDVARARAAYLSGGSFNLNFLLRHRYEWMNAYLRPDAVGIEVGCGTGLSKEFIRARNYRITDFADYDWLDVKGVDAVRTPFDDATLDFVVTSNMIHHLPFPVRFFREMDRILKPGGVLLVQEINCSLAMRCLLRLMRHEGYSFEPNVFDESLVCTDPDDLWSANCAIPNLLFDDVDRFHREVPFLRVERSTFSEFFCMINSGGVIAKTRYLPLPRFALGLLKLVDDCLTSLLPGVFALQRQVVLRKVAPVVR